MRKPDRAKVLGQWVDILYVDLKPEGEKDDENLFGDCDVPNRVIRIEKTLEGELFKRTLRHEKQHMKLGISGLSNQLSPELEEQLCDLAEVD